MSHAPWPRYAIESTKISRRLQFPNCESLNRSSKRRDLCVPRIARTDWPLWLRPAGLKLRPEKRSPRFDTYALALQAAADGLGIAISLRPYVADDLAAGRLVVPFPLTVPKGKAWYLIWPPARLDDPAFIAFRQWLTARSS